METQELVSSNLKSASWSEDTGLIVTFKDGRRYRYPEVPRPYFTELVSSPSAGKFFCAQVKPRFAYEKLDEAKASAVETD